jgi:hypothetical protein
MRDIETIYSELGTWRLFAVRLGNGSGSEWAAAVDRRAGGAT